jgi:hypothetical protein
MATLRKRGTKWQVRVRREGHPNVSKTFRRHLPVQDSSRDGWEFVNETKTRARSAPVTDKDDASHLLWRSSRRSAAAIYLLSV